MSKEVRNNATNSGIETVERIVASLGEINQRLARIDPGEEMRFRMLPLPGARPSPSPQIARQQDAAREGRGGRGK